MKSRHLEVLRPEHLSEAKLLDVSTGEFLKFLRQGAVAKEAFTLVTGNSLTKQLT